MATYRMKLCAVNGIDASSLRSMLQLSDTRLNNQWVIGDSGQIDLYVYGTDSAEGRQQLRNHQRGITAALSQTADLDTPADLHIKKPLRAKQLVDTLNEAEEKIAYARRADKVAHIPETPRPTPPKIKPISKDDPFFEISKKPSLLGSLSKQLNKWKSPAQDLPSLSLYTPAFSDLPSKTIFEPKALSSWLAKQPSQDKTTLINNLLDKLSVLNRSELPADSRLVLMEIYRQPVNNLVFSRDVDTIKLEMAKPDAFEANVSQLSLFLEELTFGYKQILMAAYQRGQRPQSDDLFLFAIIRAAEALSLLIIHAFRHYLSPPTGAVHELHQLYLYCEAADVLDKKVTLKVASSGKPFIHFYNQIMLTGVADPYSLGKYDVFRLFNLMAKVADKVVIAPLNEHQKGKDSTALAGNFCLDCASDHIPIPLHHVEHIRRQLPETRILNPQGVLFAIENIFEAAASTKTMGAYDLHIQLLKKVAPQFNATYERQYQRLAEVEPRPIRLVNGLTAIHHCIQQIDFDDDLVSEWTVINQGSGGLKAKCDKPPGMQLNIGDFMGIFEAGLSPRLATVRWLHIDNNNTLEIGLHLHPGDPSAGDLLPDDQAQIIPCLMLPAIDALDQADTLIVEKGVYSPQRRLQLKNGDQTNTIKIEQLCDYSINYEQFSYRIIRD